MTANIRLENKLTQVSTHKNVFLHRRVYFIVACKFTDIPVAIRLNRFCKSFVLFCVTYDGAALSSQASQKSPPMEYLLCSCFEDSNFETNVK